MKTYKNIYLQVCSYNNLILAWKRAKKHKTKKFYVIEFEEKLLDNIKELQKELENETYIPAPLKTFILRDPKTRKISKANFRDRIVHHTIVNIIGPILEKRFIYDSCANQIGKGNLFALKRFDLFKRKVTCNLKKETFCFKADIKHYFQEINHNYLIDILEKKIKDDKLIRLIKKILVNGQYVLGVGMPLGNLTSQFFANVYLNELDYFVKHKLKAKYYIRYVDDFVILHSSKKQLEVWKQEISRFLNKKLKIELHPDKSKIIPLSRGVDFVGFRNFYYHRLLRKRNIRNIYSKIEKFKLEYVSYEKLIESFQGWNAYAKWADCFKLRKRIFNDYC